MTDQPAKKSVCQSSLVWVVPDQVVPLLATSSQVAQNLDDWRRLRRGRSIATSQLSGAVITNWQAARLVWSPSNLMVAPSGMACHEQLWRDVCQPFVHTLDVPREYLF